MRIWIAKDNVRPECPNPGTYIFSKRPVFDSVLQWIRKPSRPDDKDRGMWSLLAPFPNSDASADTFANMVPPGQCMVFDLVSVDTTHIKPQTPKPEELRIERMGQAVSEAQAALARLALELEIKGEAD
jgi:hypothetical protein